MAFYPHGYYKLWVTDQVLYAELHGAWNTETALNFEKEFIALAQKFPDEWGHLVYLDHWELGTPEISEIIERLVGWCIENGLRRAANVYKPSQIKSAVLNKMVVLEEGGFKRAVFDNPQNAAQWLSDGGFSVILEAPP